MNETRIDPMLRIHFNIVEFIRDNKSIGFPRRRLLLSQFTRHRWGNLMLTSEQGVHYWKRRTDKKLQSWQVNCLFFIGYYCSMLARCMIPFFLIYFLFWSKPEFFQIQLIVCFWSFQCWLAFVFCLQLKDRMRGSALQQEESWRYERLLATPLQLEFAYLVSSGGHSVQRKDWHVQNEMAKSKYPLVVKYSNGIR